jgi:hypothetical protein
MRDILTVQPTPVKPPANFLRAAAPSPHPQVGRAPPTDG